MFLGKRFYRPKQSAVKMNNGTTPGTFILDMPLIQLDDDGTQHDLVWQEIVSNTEQFIIVIEEYGQIKEI